MAKVGNDMEQVLAVFTHPGNSRHFETHREGVYLPLAIFLTHNSKLGEYLNFQGQLPTKCVRGLHLYQVSSFVSELIGILKANTLFGYT